MSAVLSAFLRDRAKLLIGASEAARYLERRTANAGPTVTIATDELREIAEQFERVVALLSATHVAEAMTAKEQAAA